MFFSLDKYILKILVENPVFAIQHIYIENRKSFTEVNGQRMYFLVNASPPIKAVGRSNFELCRCIGLGHMM